MRVCKWKKHLSHRKSGKQLWQLHHKARGNMESAEACKTTTNIEDNMTNLRVNDLTGEWVDGWIDKDEFTVGVAPTTQLVD